MNWVYFGYGMGHLWLLYVGKRVEKCKIYCDGNSMNIYGKIILLHAHTTFENAS